MAERPIPVTPDGIDKCPTFCPSAQRKERRRRRTMLPSSRNDRKSRATKSEPAETLDAPVDVVSDYRDVACLKTSLENVQRDMMTDPSDLELEGSLREVIKECTVVRQDLSQGTVSQEGQMSHQRTPFHGVRRVRWMDCTGEIRRRYPQRQRTSLMQSYREKSSPTKKSERRIEKSRSGKGPNGQGRRKLTETAAAKNREAIQREGPPRCLLC